MQIGWTVCCVRLRKWRGNIRSISKMGMKPFAVSYHIQENYRKLHVTRKPGALLAARSLGLI